MKKVLIWIALLLFAAITVLVFRTAFYFNNKQFQVSAALSPVPIERGEVVKHLSDVIKIPTISYDSPEQVDYSQFLALHQYLQQTFPLVHQKATVTKVNDYSLLFELKGSDATLKPALLMGHMDVVPADEQTLNQWQHPPFSGAIAGNAIWGRGAIDDKVTVMAVLEATEKLLEQGKTFKRSLYLAFGHDEEVGGKQGAKAIAEHLKQQNIQFEYVLDEGGAVTKGLMKGVAQPVAMVGIAEKGFVNFRLSVKSEGGHSSQPPNPTAVSILSQAIVQVQNSPFASDLNFIRQTFDYVGYYTPLSSRLPMANLWLFSPIVEKALLANPSTAASIHTTIAPTMLQGSSKSNVLPSLATAVVNFRIMPGDTIASVEQHIRNAIDDPRVEISSFMGNEASKVSSTNSLGFKLIEKTIRRLDDSILVAPYLVQGGTDSKYFYALSDNVYRFLMVRLNQDTIKRFHGIDEQIPIDDYMQAIQFYYALIEQTVQPQ
ncbi:M20 family peptidase [Neptunicella marina]|uniref:M20/M25/M40 family metallo-hydrolase n=1 Tax=Neptunicella marina TaxID=2125989 RepID=A0A8J6IT21_9ALTE|nr:M20 family peptidase [Neptunicella marina]MBC3765285.1 M20/M25/M40 family metallo-hydrolase [Neptunicella marina]